MMFGLAADEPTPSTPTDLLGALVPSGGDTLIMAGVAAVILLPWLISALGPATSTTYHRQSSRGDSGRARRRSKTARKAKSRRTAEQSETVEEALERARAHGREILAKKYRGEG